MNENFLEDVFCPFCGYPLAIGETFKKEKHELVEAITTCACGEYPITSGILILKKHITTNKAISLLREKRFSDATSCLVEVKPFSNTARLISLVEETPFRNLTLIVKKIYSKPLFQDLSFFETLDKLKWGIYSKYLKERTSDVDFFENRVLIHLFMKSFKTTADLRFLDLCGGVGHNGYVLSKYSENVTCLDKFFINLFVAKKFFVPKGNFINLDANLGLPFEDNYFSGIVCSDAFYYITSKRALSTEMKNKIATDGFLMTTTLPNLLRTGRGYYSGAMLPQDYLGYFTDLNAKIFPHGKLFREFMAGEKLNLEDSKISEVNKAMKLYVLATQKENFFKTYENPGEEIFNIARENLVMNPLLVNKDANLEAKTKFELWKQSVLIDVPRNYS